MSEGKLVWVFAPGVWTSSTRAMSSSSRLARGLGDRLIAGVASDATAAAYKPVPIMSMEERLAVVSACRYVDRVLPIRRPASMSPPSTAWVPTSPFTATTSRSHELERSFPGLMAAGRMKLVPYTATISSRQIIERVANRLREGSLRVRL